MFHHTGEGVERPSVEAVARYQTSPGAQDDFPAIAYHIYVEGDGTIKLCHDLNEVCWANGPGSPIEKQGIGIFNWWTIACCFAGDNPTEAQITAMKRVADALDVAVGHQMERTCHRQVCTDPVTHAPLTECPGAEWSQWLHRVQIRN